MKEGVGSHCEAIEDIAHYANEEDLLELQLDKVIDLWTHTQFMVRRIPLPLIGHFLS